MKIVLNLRYIQRQQLEKTNWVKHWSGTQRKQHEDLIQNKHILFCTIKYSYSGNEMKWFPSILLFAFSITGNERKKNLKKTDSYYFSPKIPQYKSIYKLFEIHLKNSTVQWKDCATLDHSKIHKLHLFTFRDFRAGSVLTFNTLKAL